MLMLPDSHPPCEDIPALPATKPLTGPSPQWATVVHGFTQMNADAYRKLNADFGLALDAKGFARLQDLFRTLLRRDPTVGELFLLDQLDRLSCRQPHRRAMGELYTNSPAIAETWADMMVKHRELYAAKGLLRDKPCIPPPCTVEDALSLLGRYLHRKGMVSPLTDRLLQGEKNAKGRIAVLSTPAQEADAIAEGYVLLKRLDLENATRSLWVRRGPAMAVTPVAPGDFLVCLPSPDPEVLADLLTKERMKKRPSVGGIVPLSRRSPLEAVLALCDGADIYPTRLPRSYDEIQADASPLAHLCKPPILNPDTHPDYLLRIPAPKIREWVETFRGAGIAALPVGQVKTGEQICIYLKQGHKEMPVAELSASLLRTYPSMTLYRCQAEIDPARVAEIPPATVLDLPEMGLTMTSAAVTLTGTGEGYTAAMKAISAAASPLTADGIPTREIRLSVSVLDTSHERELDGPLTELVCGLYRAAAEGGMAMEDPSLTRVAPDMGQSPAIHLSVVAYRPSHGQPIATTKPTIPPLQE